MLIHDYDLARWLIGADADTIYGMGGVYAFEGLKEVGDMDNCIITMSLAMVQWALWRPLELLLMDTMWKSKYLEQKEV